MRLIAIKIFNRLAVVVKSKGTDIAVCEITSPLWEITCHMGSHSVTCSDDFPASTTLDYVATLPCETKHATLIILPLQPLRKVRSKFIQFFYLIHFILSDTYYHNILLTQQ